MRDEDGAGRRNARRPWLLPLVPVYGAVTGARRWLAGWGLARRRWLKGPVISVGSCSAGGAGKTPVVLLLARLLTKRGYAVRVLTRGYGRRSDAVERVNPMGDAGWYGDEPMLLARRSGAPVFVGQDRYEAGLLAEQEPADDRIAVHILDDGFQHWGLGRDVDVVLLTKEDTEDALLPAGNLRESLAALRHADVIVLREEELEWTEKFVTNLRHGARAPLLWVVRRRLWLGMDLPQRPVVFCGIARPDGFIQMLQAKGLEGAEKIFFADHYSYGEADITRLLEVARRVGADGFVTTEKDAVKLSATMLKSLEAVGPVVVARLEMELLDEKEAMDGMIKRVRVMERRRRGKATR
ncbi:tetraacyldisaccharide 4'-kinase [soil metagenome]